ncbi:hypothetical protein [Patulibacter defluvii]|uniref:hypothetical protein n=1 Tax=Patulibacter defluvii TaxID=3095358 RepID=UPI002A76630B|nr:hypothetical protein [Patulibacter sp. DM4]
MSAAVSEVLATAAEWTDAEGVAAYLGEAVPATTISDLARARRLPSVKLGTRRIFHLPTVTRALLDAMESGKAL